MTTRVSNSIVLAPLCLFLLLTACGANGDGETVAASPEARATALTAEPPEIEELANATFPGILDEPVPLSDGDWQGEPYVEGGASAPAVGLVKRFRLTGDLNGDGAEEAAVLLWSSTGGSGTFDYLVVAGRGPAGVEILATAELGDRVQVRDGRIVEGRIELDMIEAGPEDAACCPTQLASRVWQLQGDTLAEISHQVTGSLTTEILSGTHWRLSDFAWDEPAPDEPEATLSFEADQVAGTAGCNRYFGGIETADDTVNSLSFSALGSTRMMCPEEVMAVEDRFLAQLGAVGSYSFLAGHLALSWHSDLSAGVMLFEPREPPQVEPPS